MAVYSSDAREDVIVIILPSMYFDRERAGCSTTIYVREWAVYLIYMLGKQCRWLRHY